MEKKQVDALKEWLSYYIKNRDIHLRRIERLRETENGFEACLKDRQREAYVVSIELNTGALSGLSAERLFLVVPNTQKNLGLLIEKWRELASIKNLTIIFVNPRSSLETRWLINPYVHSRVCDDKALAQGLKAMFETVEAWR